LDSFFAGSPAEIVTQIQKVTKPLQPLIDVLDADLR